MQFKPIESEHYLDLSSGKTWTKNTDETGEQFAERIYNDLLKTENSLL